MKVTFPLSYRKPYLNKYTLFIMLLIFIGVVFVVPFFPWSIKLVQPFSFSILIEYLKYNFHHFPISDKQADDLVFISIYMGIYLIIDLIIRTIRLTVTPEKIYYSFFNIPFEAVIERQTIDYCQFGILEVTQGKFTTFLQRPIFNTKKAKPEEKLYFFSLKTLQLDLDISSLQEDKKSELIQLLKQYYNFKEGIQEITLTAQAQRNLFNEQFNINVSPRIVILLIASVPIGGLGMFLAAQAPFLFFTNYPSFLIFCSLFLLIFIASFFWIRQDIKQFAFLGAIFSSTFITIALSAFLLPIVHSYYTINFGQTTTYSAKLIEVSSKHQVWQPSNGDDKFYIRPQYPKYNPNLKANQTYIFPARYHLHNYTLSENVFLDAKPLAAKLEVQKKTAK